MAAARELRYHSRSAVYGDLAYDLDLEAREHALRHAGEAPRHQTAEEKAPARAKPRVRSLSKEQVRQRQKVSVLSVLGVGAAIYLTALSGSLLGLLVLAGYVLLVEDNQWLRLSAVKAVAVYLFFTFVIQAVGYVPDVLGIISDAGNLFSAYISVPVLNDIVTLVKDLIYLAEKIFLMVLGVKALNQGTVAVPFVDKLVVKYL